MPCTDHDRAHVHSASLHLSSPWCISRSIGAYIFSAPTSRLCISRIGFKSVVFSHLHLWHFNASKSLTHCRTSSGFHEVSRSHYLRKLGQQKHRCCSSEILSQNEPHLLIGLKACISWLPFLHLLLDVELGFAWVTRKLQSQFPHRSGGQSWTSRGAMSRSLAMWVVNFPGHTVDVPHGPWGLFSNNDTVNRKYNAKLYGEASDIIWNNIALELNEGEDRRSICPIISNVGSIGDEYSN